MTVYFSGYVFQDDGDALSGATVQLLQVSDGAEEASTTTDSNGLWAFNEADDDRYDVKITSGTSVRYRKWADEISLKTLDVRNNEGNTVGAASFTNLTNNASNQVAIFSGANSTRADGDEIYLSFKLANSAGDIEEFARITAEAVDVTDGAEDGQLRFGVAKTDGTITDVFTINSTTGGETSMTLDVSGDLTLDADGGDVFFKDGGTTFGSATNNSGNLIIKSGTTTAATFTGANVLFAGTVDATTDFTIGDTVITDGVITDSTGLQLVANLDINGTADISGDVTLSGGADGALQFTNAGENSIKIPDNQASALIIEEANNAYITFNTTNSSEAITVAKATTFSVAATLATGTTIGNLTLANGSITDSGGALDFGNETLTTTGSVDFGAATVDSLSVSDANITNVADIALDSISADGTDINVAVSDNSATALTIKQGSDAYLIVDTANSSESVAIGTGISGTAISIGHSTSETTINDNLTVTGTLAVNGDSITADGDLTINASSNIYIQDHLKPQADDSYDLGSSGYAWRNLYLEGNITMTDAGTIATSAGDLTLNPAGGVASSKAITVTQTAAPHYDFTGNWSVATHANPYIANVSGVGMTLGTYKLNVITNASSSTGVDFSIDHNGHVNIANGSLEVATIDYTDGDLAMTIADGGGVTFAGTASSLTHPAAVVDIKPSFTGTSGSSTGIQLHPTFTDANADVHFGTHIKYTFNESGATQPSARAVWLEDSAVTGTVTSMVGLYIDNFNSGASSSGTSLYIAGGGTYALHVAAGTSLFAGSTQFGVDDTGVDVTFYGATAGRHVLWDENQNRMHFLDNTYLGFGGTAGNASVDTTMYHTGSGMKMDTDDLTIQTSTSNKPILQVKNSNADALPPYFQFYKNSSSPHNDDFLGTIQWYGKNGSGTEHEMAALYARMSDVSDNSTNEEDAHLVMSTIIAGNLTNVITTSGTTISATSWNETSDAILKENIQEIATSIDTVKQLRPVTFDWKETKKSSIGFVAQDVEGLIPDVVMSYDSDENVNKKYKSIKSSGILAHVTKALQESIEKIETLEAQVKELQEA